MLGDLRDQILRREIKYSYYIKILRVNNQARNWTMLD